MSQFKFSCDQHGRDYTQVVFEADNIDEVIERFEEFLRGCGYYFHGQITRYEDEPHLTDTIRRSVVTQPLATDSVELGAELSDPRWEGQDY